MQHAADGVLGVGVEGSRKRRSWTHVSFTIPLIVCSKAGSKKGITDAKVLVRDMLATLNIDENLTWFVL